MRDSREGAHIHGASASAAVEPRASVNGLSPNSRGAAKNGIAEQVGGPPMEGENKYRPSEKEPFMNELQREYFRLKLQSWREEILNESEVARQQLQGENRPDLVDRASTETDQAIELRARDRQRKLIAKIDAALGRLDAGTYGFCKETGEPIALKRLEARPIATLSVEAQERHERRERLYRDD
jgi:DnaK suppressor protein